MRCAQRHADRGQPDQARNEESRDGADCQDGRQKPKELLVPTLPLESSANGVAQKRSNSHDPNHPAWGARKAAGQRPARILQQTGCKRGGRQIHQTVELERQAHHFHADQGGHDRGYA
jgi:hypothetical protein